MREKGSPWKGENSLAEGFSSKGCALVHEGWNRAVGQGRNWEDMGEKERISIATIIFSLIEIQYFFQKVVRYAVS